MVEISLRIQRLVVRCFLYQPFNVRYRKGMEIPLVDVLNYNTHCQSKKMEFSY